MVKYNRVGSVQTKMFTRSLIGNLFLSCIYCHIIWFWIYRSFLRTKDFIKTNFMLIIKREVNWVSFFGWHCHTVTVQHVLSDVQLKSRNVTIDIDKSSCFEIPRRISVIVYWKFKLSHAGISIWVIRSTCMDILMGGRYIQQVSPLLVSLLVVIACCLKLKLNTSFLKRWEKLWFHVHVYTCIQ